ncbi:uncharacterized protein LOC107786107 [Nicotiana tabacum]|uniref:Uncharacterized protein LOC107786107 n=1 Tax=Nicotiana tabacum TaxID=4097 RepID=A0A1S3ZEX7_TOBAC|nr:PREDICTED: uncharacterized protein LOC107786107 [Nicotiana tabacum]
MSLPEEFLVECFLLGLRPDILASFKAHKLTQLDQVIDLAHIHEQRLIAKKVPARPAFSRTQPRLPMPGLTSSSLPVQPLQTTFSSTARLPIKRLTLTEMYHHRELGLFFNYDEKYSVTHRCKAGLHLLLLVEETDNVVVLPEPFVSDNVLVEELQCLEVQEHSAISYHALAGRTSPNSMCFVGHVNGSPVQVLLDGGNTHNFIQTRVTQFFQLQVESTPYFSVVVGSGQCLPYEGVCRQVSLTIQGSTLALDFHVLPLHGSDLVLGVSWLDTLGPVITNYRARLFEFNYKGQRYSWRGDPPIELQPVQLHSLCRMAATHAISSFYRLELVTDAPLVSDAPPPEIAELLDSFSQVFQKPHGLPPTRPLDHAIHLLPGSKPVNVKPYRYPYFQKNIMEQLVGDILKEGIIRPSTSPFLSPVLLVQKKNGTWNFYVDYRALNAVTVHDRFLILTSDELFDELHGAQFFSKLDLLSGYHQIRVRLEDVGKTAFRTHEGHFDF